MNRHFCVTVYVYNPDNKKFLMVLHRKLNKWVPPGGHIDPHEIPDVAALRETIEETGVAVRLVGPKSPAQDCLVTPYGIQRNIIQANEHEHLDLIYAAFPTEGEVQLQENDRESRGIGWFTLEQVQAEGFVTFPTVRQWTTFFAGEFS